MRIPNASRVVALLTLAALFALGADITGKWKGTSDSGREVLLDLKADGQTLTGAVTVDQGKARDISDGKVEGDSVSFHMPSEHGGNISVCAGDDNE